MFASGLRVKDEFSEGSGCTPTAPGHSCTMRWSIATLEPSGTFPALASGRYTPRPKRSQPAWSRSPESFTLSGDDKQPGLCLSESRVYMPYTAHPLPLPSTPTVEPQTRPDTSFDPVEFLQRLFDEPADEAQRRLDAVKRRREFRLIQGA